MSRKTKTLGNDIVPVYHERCSVDDVVKSLVEAVYTKNGYELESDETERITNIIRDYRLDIVQTVSAQFFSALTEIYPRMDLGTWRKIHIQVGKDMDAIGERK